MKAVLHTAYGPADLLQIAEVDTPIPKHDEIRIKVHTTTVASGDCNVRNFTFVSKSMIPLAKLIFGFRKPRKTMILGTQVAGEVESVGKDVSKFKVGDKVFASSGANGGGHAQYTCLPEHGPLALMPEHMNYEEAVAIPFGADTALYYLRDLGKIREGHEVLILGASGSVGTAAVQLAKHFGAKVTGVCSTRNLDLVTSLGADKVIDYTKENFTQRSELYDLILDTVAATSFKHCKSSLKPKGLFLPCIMSLFDMFFRIPWTALWRGRRLKGGVALENAERMKVIKELADQGKLKPVIDRTYPLDQIIDAFRYVETGRKRGSVVITVD